MYAWCLSEHNTSAKNKRNDTKEKVHNIDQPIINNVYNVFVNNFSIHVFVKLKNTYGFN